MPSNNIMTPSPKQRNRFISTLRRTLRPNMQSASPTTPPTGKSKTTFSALLDSRESHSSSPTSSGSSDLSTPSPSTRSPQPTAQQRRYAAVFSKITFSTAEFIEDRYIYSHSPEKAQAPLSLPTGDLIPGPSFFAIPSTRQPSVSDQPDIRLDQTSNPTEHRISFLGLSDAPSSSSPLRSCFQEVFDLIDAGLAGDPSDLIGADILDGFHLPAIDRSVESFPGDSTSEGSMNPTQVGTSEQSFDHDEDNWSEEPADPLEANTSEEIPSIHTASMSEEPFGLVAVCAAEECLDRHDPEITDEHVDVPEPEPNMALDLVTSTDDSIQRFLHSLSASLRDDPTEFSPRISLWDQESTNDFSWLQLDDEPAPPPEMSLSDSTPSTDYFNHLPRFLKRSPARAKKLSPKKRT